MDSTHRSFGWIHAVLALAVAIQFVASWFYDQDVSNDVWAILNYFMAIGVIAAVAFSYERWRGTDASCTAPGFLDTRLRYAAWRSSYCSRASSGVRYASFSRRQHWL